EPGGELVSDFELALGGLAPPRLRERAQHHQESGAGEVRRALGNPGGEGFGGARGVLQRQLAAPEAAVLHRLWNLGAPGSARSRRDRGKHVAPGVARLDAAGQELAGGVVEMGQASLAVEVQRDVAERLEDATEDLTEGALAARCA